MNDAAGAFVAIDQGGHATRAVAYDVHGGRLGSAFATVDTLRLSPDRVEHDGESLVGSVRSVLRDLATQVSVARWCAIGLAVQRSTIACWDRQTGAMLAPVISWQDRRQAGWLQGLAGHAARVHEITGLPLSPHYGASKLRWCLDNVDAVRVAAAEGRLCAGPLASLLLARLLDGRPCVADEANASRTQLWSPHDRCWSTALLDLFGVPAVILPQLVPTCTEFGSLRVDGVLVPLRACTGDQAAVPFAAGRVDPDAVYVNLGTGAFALRRTRQPMRAPPLLTSVLSSDATTVHYAIEGTVNGAGSALQWLGEREQADIAPLLSALDRAPAGTFDAPFFLNGISGIGSPFWVAQFDSHFIGGGEALDRCRAVLESIAFLLRANLDEMAKHVGRPQKIVASGGLAHSAFLLRTLATLARVPVHRLDDTEATASGVACLAAGQPGGWGGTLSGCFEPVDDPVLEARYARWLGLLDDALRR